MARCRMDKEDTSLDSGTGSAIMLMLTPGLLGARTTFGVAQPSQRQRLSVRRPHFPFVTATNV